MAQATREKKHPPHGMTPYRVMDIAFHNHSFHASSYCLVSSSLCPFLDKVNDLGLQLHLVKPLMRGIPPGLTQLISTSLSPMISMPTKIEPIPDQSCPLWPADLLFLGRHIMLVGLGAGMDVGPEIPILGLSSHGPQDLSVQQKNPHISHLSEPRPGTPGP